DDNTWFQTARLSVAKADIVTDADFYDAESETGRYKFSYQLGHRFYTPELGNSEHTVTAGYDLTHETFANNLLFRSYDRTANSFIGEYRGKFDNQFFLTAALRHDFNDTFEDFTSYSLSGAWQVPNSGTRLHASVGTGSANP